MKTTDFSKNKSLWALSLLCFSLADIQDGLGPFLGVYLQQQKWNAEEIGYVMTLGGLAGLIFAAPLGAFADHTKKKRLIILLAALCIIISSAAVFINSSFAVAGFTKILQGAAAAAIPPALTGITLGLTGQTNFAEQLGKNEAWNHAGNASTAILCGITGYLFGFTGILLILFFMGISAILSLWHINPKLINHNLARGLDKTTNPADIPAIHHLLTNKTLLLIGTALFFFHLGNAALLPLLGQSAVAQFQVNPAFYTAGTIIIAQCTMIITALLAAKTAQKQGYIFLFYFAFSALPVRGIIAGFWINPWNIIPVQILDGIGAGILGVAMPGLVAQILNKSGHINLGIGTVLTIQGIGAALSNAYGGFFAHHFHYNTAFLALAAAPCFGLLLFTAAVKKLNLQTQNKI